MMPRSAGLSVDDVRLIRPALVHAVAVARTGLAADPPEPPPEGLRRVLGFRRLQTAALETVRRILDSDDEFRRRVVQEADEASLGRLAWLWLTRPEGSAGELAELAASSGRDETDDGGAGREVARLRRALNGAEESARRHEASADQALQAGRRARADLAKARAQRTEAERDAAAARTEAGRSSVERDAALRDREAMATEVERLTVERDIARHALHDAETELAVERTARHPSAGRAGESGQALKRGGASKRGGARPGPRGDRAADRRSSTEVASLADRVLDAASTAAELSRTLAEIGGEISGEISGEAGSARGRPQTAPDGEKAPGRRSARLARPRRREPAAMPPGVWDDAPEAAAHLVRLPGAVVLVDGYNVARTAWPGLTPEDERSRLIAALEELHARTGADVTVVFDGVQEGAPAPGQGSRTVRVRFTAEGIPADDVVRDLVDDFPRQRPVVVVSSDREVVDGARARGANTVSSRQFLAVLGR